AGRNDHDVTRLQLIRDAIPNFRTVVAGSIELDDGPLRGWTPLPVGDIRTENESGRSFNDVVNLADLVMFGDRVRSGLVQLSTVDHANADVSLSQFDVSHLLIDQLFGDGFLGVALQLRERDV